MHNFSRNTTLKLTAGFIIVLGVIAGISSLWQSTHPGEESLMPTLMPAAQPVVVDNQDAVAVPDASASSASDETTSDVLITEAHPSSETVVPPDELADIAADIAGQPDIIDAPETVVVSSVLPEPEQFVIQFSPQSSEADREAYLEQINAEVTNTLPQLNSVVVVVPQEVTALPPSSAVVVSEPDYYARQLYDFNQPVTDEYYDLQWSLPTLEVPDLWAALPDDAPIYTVAVVDSGICASHPDLTGKIVAGYDYVDDDTNPDTSINGHGCGVAGVIAANIDNGIGVAGVAPNAQIMPLRVLDDSGIGSHSDIASAIIYAADNGADVINLSLGSTNTSSVLYNAVTYASNQGITLVAASGNLDLGAGETYETVDVDYPARYDEVIAVGSVDENLQRSDFSVGGPEIALMAPGNQIATTGNGTSYVWQAGTSFAAPFVSGMVVLAESFDTELELNGGLVQLAPPEENPIVDQAQPGPTFTVNTTDSGKDGVCGTTHCSLRDAIVAANAYGGDAEIHLQENATYTLTAIDNISNGANGLPSITNNITIYGNDATIERNNGAPAFRLFHIGAGSDGLWLFDLTLQNGDAGTNDGGAVYAYNPGGFSIATSHVRMLNNRAENGGALYGNAGLFYTEIRNNIATQHGGGLYTVDGMSVGSLLVAYNTALNGSGGGLYSTGAFDNFNLVFSNNSAEAAGQTGGAVYHSGTSFIGLNQVSFVENRVATGGAIFHNEVDPDFMLSYALFARNTGLDCDGLITDTYSSIILSDNPAACKGVGEYSTSLNVDSLKDNGGFLETHALLAGSSAIKTAERDGFNRDIRGVYGLDEWDIGAYEAVSVTPILLPPVVYSLTTQHNNANDDSISLPWDNYNNNLDKPVSSIKINFRDTRHFFQNPAGDNTAIDISNAAHYQLISAGTNLSFDTPESCGAVQNDDISYPAGISNIEAERDGMVVTTVELAVNGGTPLPDGLYRLLLCSAGLVDTDGQALDGDLDNIPGGNLVVEFIVGTIAYIPAPSNLTANVISASQVDLVWDDRSSDETEFLIDRSTDGTNWSQIATPAADSTTYTDTTTACGQVYQYRIYAYRSSDTVSSAYATINNIIVPLCDPTGFTATAANTQIDLSWTDTNSTETAHILERSVDGGAWTEITQLAADSVTHTDTDLTCDTDYQYRLTASRDSDAASSNAILSNSVTSAPCAPDTFAAVLNGTDVDLTWADNSASETEFRIERSPDNLNWSQIATPAADSTAYMDTTSACGAVYQYRLLAYRSGDELSSAYATVTDVIMPLCDPTNFTATAATMQIDLAWGDTNSTETAHMLERSVNGGNWIEIAQLPADSETHTDTDLTCDTDYQYRLTASRDSDAASSNAVLSNSATSAPCAPDTLTYTSTDTQIDLTWVDNSASETEFRIERSPDNLNWSQIATPAADSTTYSDTTVSCETGYYYRLLTYRSGDSLSSTYSESLLALAKPCPPDEPVLPVQIGNVGNQVVIGWTPGDPAYVTEIHIERRTSGGAWGEIAIVADNVAAYTDNSIACGTSYDYRLRSYRNDTGIYSPYSTVLVFNAPACETPVTHTVGLYQNGMWYFRDANETGLPTTSFSFGQPEPGWIPVTGDWDGDGIEGIGLFKDGIWLLRQVAESGFIDTQFSYGDGGDLPVVGDWNGDGTAGIGVYRNGRFFLKNIPAAGTPDYNFVFGDNSGNWQPIAGDWDGSGADTVGLYYRGQFQLINNLYGGAAERGFVFGIGADGWQALAGDWNEDGTDTIGLYSSGIWRLRNHNSTGAPDAGFGFGDKTGNARAIASYRGDAAALGIFANTPIALPTAIPTATATPVPERTQPVEITPAPTEPEVTAEAQTTTPEPINTPAAELTPEAGA